MRDLPKQNHRFWSVAADCLAGIIALSLITLICKRLQIHLPGPTCLYLIVIVLLARRGNYI
jgi:hypothetical protein